MRDKLASGRRAIIQGLAHRAAGQEILRATAGCGARALVARVSAKRI